MTRATVATSYHQPSARHITERTDSVIMCAGTPAGRDWHYGSTITTSRIGTRDDREHGLANHARMEHHPTSPALRYHDDVTRVVAER